MSAQHTPGPWKAIRRHPDPETAALFIEVTTSNDSGPFGNPRSILTICGLHCAEIGGVQEANARLIATAPTLLETLKSILAAHDSGNNGAVMGEAVLCRYFADIARDVIAEAEGGQG